MLKLTDTLKGHSDRVWTLAWNPSGIILASSGGDKSIRLWILENDSWKCVAILTETHSKSIRKLCWSPCGQYIASASFDSSICIWRRSALDNSWSTVVNLEGHENEVKSVAWSFDGRYIASCGRDRTVWIWERPTSQDAGDEFQDDVWDCADVKNDHSKDVKHVTWHPTENILASCSYDDTVKLYSEVSGDWNCFQTLASHDSTVWSASFSSSGEYMATSSDDKTVRIWKNHSHHKLPQIIPNSWKCISVIQGYHKRAIYDVSWSKLADVIVSGSGDNSLVVYGRGPEDPANDETFVCLSKFDQAHDCDINSVAWNPKIDGLLASASDDRTIKMWRYRAEQEGRKPLTITDEILRSLKLDDDERVNSKSNSIYESKVSSHSGLLKLTQSLQILQNEYSHPDRELTLLEKTFDLRIAEESNPCRLQLENISCEENTGVVSEFDVKIVGRDGSVCHVIKLAVETSTFNLKLPKRSIDIMSIADELFVCDKTGDLFKIRLTGDSELVLGHLFVLSDFKFMRDGDNCIRFIVSADRDEKLRISNYPNSFEIERYCFGHTNMIRRIVIVDGGRFISVDQEDVAKLWDLGNLSSSGFKPIEASRTKYLREAPTKRFCSD